MLNQVPIALLGFGLSGLANSAALPQDNAASAISQISTGIFGAALSGAAAASKQSSDGTVQCPQQDDWCGFTLGSAEEAQTAWSCSGAVGAMWIQDSSDEVRDNWVEKADAEVRGVPLGQNNADCGSLGGNCKLLDDCKALNEKHQAPWYWVFKSVTNAKALAEYLKEGLQDNAIESSLEIGTLMEYWKPQDSADKTLLTYLAAAFGMGAAAAGTSPALAGGMGFFSALTSMAAEAISQDPAEYRGSMETVIKNMFKATRESIADSLKAATGRDLSLVKNLPDGSITGFFGQGRFLFNNVDAVGRPTVDNMLKRMKQALQGVVLQKTDHWVLAEDGVHNNQDECKQWPGSWWNDQTSTCYYIIEKVSIPANGCGSDPTQCGWKPLTTDQVNSINSYGVDLQELYKNACQCQFASGGEEKQPDIATLPQDGSMPPCFYPLKCMSAAPEDFTHEWSELWGFQNVPENKVPH